jgi:hypothetical protein
MESKVSIWMNFSFWTRIAWHDVQVYRNGWAFIIKEYQQNQCLFSYFGKESFILLYVFRNINFFWRRKHQQSILWFFKIFDDWVHEIKLLRSYIAVYSPKKAYKVKLKDADKDFIFNETEADLNKFDKIIDELEPGVLRLPVLIKKIHQTKCKSGLLAFNDPLFNNAVDGLMYIRSYRYSKAQWNLLWKNFRQNWKEN